MEKAVQSAHVVRFANFELDLDAGELRKNSLKLKFSGQPFEVLAILLEQPGAIVTREQLQKRLWPDSFVDFDHNLNSAINRIREALGDSAETPRFVETLPRRGYRFVGAVEYVRPPIISEEGKIEAERRSTAVFRSVPFWVSTSIVAVVLVTAAWLVTKWEKSPAPNSQHSLSRLTFDDGLQTEATWSPDGESIAYSSNRGGKFDVWAQQLNGGNPVQITQGVGNNWQPDWSPDGKYIAYRSDGGEPGIYVIPVLGGRGLERRVTPFGYHPRWSPDGTQLLFDTDFTSNTNVIDRFYVVDVATSDSREVLANSSSQRTADFEQHGIWAEWYPDGRQLSVRFPRDTPAFGISTIPLASGPATELTIPSNVTEQLKQVSSPKFKAWDGKGATFLWASSRSAIYYEGEFRGAQNIWRMNVEPRTSTATAVQRLSTGPFDSHPSLSRNGKKLAFTAESVQIRSWLFPFDSKYGRITGVGHAVTPASIRAWRNDLSRNGKTLAFVAIVGEQHEVYEKSMPDGRETPIMAPDSYFRRFPRLSFDGTKLAFVRQAPTQEGQLMIMPVGSHNEKPITSMSKAFFYPFDWSPQGDALLAARLSPDSGRAEVWLVPVSAGPHAEGAAQRILSDPSYDFYQPHFSADGRWIAFEAVKTSGHTTSSLYVISASGGPWIRITNGEPWDDKPRWSPDGRTIYFVSRRSGAFQVWGTHFDPKRGEPVGVPFQVTFFRDGGLKIPDRIQDVDLSITPNELMVTIEDRSGSIWMMDNVDR